MGRDLAWTTGGPDEPSQIHRALHAARTWSRPDVRRRVLAIGTAGLLLNGLVVLAGVAGLHRVSASYAAVETIRRAQQYHQDADMMHDALRADVLDAVLAETAGAARATAGPGQGAGRAGAGLGSGAVAENLRVHVGRYHAALDHAARIRLDDPDLQAQVRVAKVHQEHYIATAEAVVAQTAHLPTSAAVGLPAFLDEFGRLEGELGDLTVQMDRRARATRGELSQQERLAENVVLGTSLISLAGLVVLGRLLLRLGDDLARLLRRDRRIAESLQRSLLPSRLPTVAGVRVAVRYEPGGADVEVGGDWFEVIALPGGLVGLAIGDVVGHDLQAAAVMGQMRYALRACAAVALAPGEVLAALNAFADPSLDSPLATCVYLVLDPATGDVRVASAGHPAPLVRSPSGAVTLLDLDPGPPIGVLEDQLYPEARHRLEPGSLLVLFTDGLVEERGLPLSDGLLRLQALAAAGPGDLDGFSDHVVASVTRRPGREVDSADDIALLVAQLVPLSAPAGHPVGHGLQDSATR